MPDYQCPHCGLVCHPHTIERHAESCPFEPERSRAIREHLQRVSVYGVIPAQHTYLHSRGELPHPKTLVQHLGDWNKVAEWAGLLPRFRFEKEREAALFQEVIRIGVLLHDGEWGPSRSEYDLFRKIDVDFFDRPLYSASDVLVVRYGNWDRLLGLAGLKLASLDYYRKLAHERRRDSEDEWQANEHAVLISRGESRFRSVADGMSVAGQPRVRRYFDPRSGTWREREFIPLR